MKYIQYTKLKEYIILIRVG